MPAPRQLIPIDGDTGLNFRVVDRRLRDLEVAPMAIARLVPATLVAGDNRVRHGLSRARGRIVVRQSAVVDLYDVDSVDPSVWVINASAPVQVTLLFF